MKNSINLSNKVATNIELPKFILGLQMIADKILSKTELITFFNQLIKMNFGKASGIQGTKNTIVSNIGTVMKTVGGKIKKKN